MVGLRNKFNDIKQHIDLGLYNDSSWVKKSKELLKELKSLLPKEYDITNLSEELKQPEWYVTQILMWCYMDEEKLEIELESHGSILFYYLKDYISSDEEEAIYEQLAKATTNDSTADHINSILLKRFEEDSTKINKKLTKEEVIEQKLKEIDTTVWEFLFTDIDSWDADDKFKQLILKLKKAGKFNLNKADTHYFRDTLKAYVNLGYLDEKSPQKKVLLYKEIKSMFG